MYLDKLATIFLSFCLASCSYFKRDNKPDESTTGRSDALISKKAFYCEQGKILLNERGFMDNECDSLLFTSLWSVACGPVSMQSWEDVNEPGKWHRNPNRDCYLPETGPNGSASSISRDMFLGLWHHLWSIGDKENIREIRQYGEAHNWIMGDAKDNETLLSRCLLTPQLISLLQDMDGSAKLVDDSADALPLNTGYRAHLDVLRILLSGRVRGAISDSELATLKGQAERQPNNALFVAAYELYVGGTRAVELLLDTKYFPSERLPKATDYCTTYLFSRDEGTSDWQPCGEAPVRQHDGTDFVFAAWVALGG